MKKIAIIGGGIVGMTLANYLDTGQYEISLYDHQKNQATRASAGIISPWLSKRRNKKWYQLAKDGAGFFEKLVKDFEIPDSIYERCGTIFIRKEEALAELEALAIERRKEAPEIGDIRLLTEEETVQYLPLLKAIKSLYISGGARLDGKAYLEHLENRARNRGVKIYRNTAQIQKSSHSWLITTEDNSLKVDELVLCPGPGLAALMESIGYQADIYPQKGQLLSFATDFSTEKWPVAFLDGEADLIPFQKGKILIGATHENEAGWDLTPTKAAFEQLTKGVSSFIKDSSFIEENFHYRVGTRAYTSDFSPFFGKINEENGPTVAAGLGSSGLTTGPYIAYLLAQSFNHASENWDFSKYQKEMGNYIKPFSKPKT